MDGSKMVGDNYLEVLIPEKRTRNEPQPRYCYRRSLTILLLDLKDQDLSGFEGERAVLDFFVGIILASFGVPFLIAIR